MKNNMMTIIKKELYRLLGDKKTLFTTVLLPGVMIYVLYTFMGQGMMQSFTTEDDYQYEISVVNASEQMKPLLTQLPATLTYPEETDVEVVKEKIANKETDLLVIYPKNFDEEVAAYDSQNAVAEYQAPEIEMYYNSTRTESADAYRMMVDTCDTYESMLANKFDINRNADEFDLASKKDETGKFFSMMLPMLLMIFMFSGCMSVATESIAGEKERGTIATLLVTPMKRSHLALGKIISLGIIGLLSGISSFLGTMLSLPNMFNGIAGSDDMLSADVYTPLDYVMLLIVILSTVLVIVAAISVVSAFSKSVKEASTAVMPLMIVVMVVSITSMMGNGAPSEWYLYLIPFYNSVQCMNGVFGFSALTVNVVITVVSNVVYTFVMAGVLAKIFDSEKIMYI